MEQYDGSIAMKYMIFDNMRIRPYVGAAGDYIFRKYKDRISYGYFYQYDNYTQEQSTNSFNASLLAGVDFKLTDRLSIGGEFKYSVPVYLQNNGLITESYVMAYAKPLEESTFTSWLVSLKFNF